MTNQNKMVTKEMLRTVFNLIEIKMPNFLTDEIKANFERIIAARIANKNKHINDVAHYQVVSSVKKCKGLWDFVFEYTHDGNINIVGYLTGILSTEKKCKFKSLAVVKIGPRPEEDHFVGKYIKKMYDAGELTISEYDKLMWKFSQFPETVRNRIDGSMYNPVSKKLDLTINPFIQISISAKGFTSIPVTIYKPVRIEFKIAQKFIREMDVILKHHW